MGNPILTMGLLIYLLIFSMCVAYVANGTGYSGVEAIGIDWDGPITTGIQVVDTLAYWAQFLFTIGAVILWTIPDGILPLWMNALLVKIPLIGLVASVIEL